jgi:hypothetical protein
MLGNSIEESSVKRVANSVGCLAICYGSFCTANIPCFLSYSIPVLHVAE